MKAIFILFFFPFLLLHQYHYINIKCNLYSITVHSENYLIVLTLVYCKYCKKCFIAHLFFLSTYFTESEKLKEITMKLNMHKSISKKIN